MHEIMESARSRVMTLRSWLSSLPDARALGDLDVELREVRDDSRQVERGDLFVAVRGRSHDGHRFLATAIERGAAAVVVEAEQPGLTVPQVIVPSTATALGLLVARAKGDPAKAMTLVGITGTNGKTTTTYLIERILAAAGHRPGVIGTVTYRWAGQEGSKELDAPYTTPTPEVLHDTLATMRADGVTHVVMEVSSAALAMDRLAGVTYAVAGFSNLTQDHLDLHGSMEAYRDAKRLLFSRHLAGAALVNVDDPEGEGMGAAATGQRVLRVSAIVDGQAAAQRDAEIKVVWCESTVRGIRARIRTPRGELAIEAPPLVGAYNVANLAMAVGMAEALGIPHVVIARGIASLPGVPGRVERVPNDAELDILVDYAHTPDALRNVLAALRPLTQRRLICVFGCGGDRDPTKRPKMGAAVAELADLAVVTSDNPRTEEPRAILDMILPAVPRPFFVDVDRRAAIQAAIAEATPGDVVVIAGKGHEDYQILGTTKHHFDDREEANAAVALRPRWTVAQLAEEANGALTAGAAGHADPAAPIVHRLVIDSRKVARGDLYVAIRGESHDGHDFCPAAIAAGAVALLVDGTADALLARVPILAGTPIIAVADTRLALGAIAAAHRRRWAPDRLADLASTAKGPAEVVRTLVAITGSAGKTTTKELTRAALAERGPTLSPEGSLNNETGVPLTLLALRPFHRFAVIEMGMRGLGQIEHLTRMAEPDLALVVNAGTAHLELLGTTDAIAEAKGEIWLGLRRGGLVIRPSDDARLDRWARAHQPAAPHLTFGEGEDATVRLVGYQPLPDGGELTIEVGKRRHLLCLGLLGRHAALDACAALAAALGAGLTIEQALRGLARARPPAMRGEVVELAGRHVIVDCYNANPASMAAGLRTLAERATGHRALAVIGDMLELGPTAGDAHRDAGALAATLGVELIALGDFAATILAGAAAVTTTVAGELAPDPATAAARALARTAPGDWILLKASRGMRLERVLAAMRGAL
jgi:murE/murF fusion protein